MGPHESRPEEIIAFWFSTPVRPRWFRPTTGFDAQLEKDFGTDVQRAASGALDGWKASPQGCLALVILLDQFMLNIFRNTAQAFAGEAAARAVAEHALALGFDQALSPDEKAFLYMPFMHSESLDDQDRSVALYRVAGLEHNLKFALHHRDIIRRFGRFPHRNAILGRPSNIDEITYLASADAFKG